MAADEIDVFCRNRLCNPRGSPRWLFAFRPGSQAQIRTMCPNCKVSQVRDLAAEEANFRVAVAGSARPVQNHR
jgi:hypothetical protein